MRFKAISIVCMMLVGAVVLSAAAPQNTTDPLTGTWTGDWGPTPTHRNQVTVQLKWNGQALTGTVNPDSNPVTLKNCTFDPNTGKVHMEADATNRRGVAVHFMIDGKVKGNTMTGRWDHGSRHGDFKITRQQSGARS